jgi:hypothetical protein
MEIKGIIHKILPEQSGLGKDGKPWRKQQFVIKDERGTEKAFTAYGDKMDIIPAKNKIGEPIIVHCDAFSKQINENFYATELRLWKIEYLL